VTTLKKIAVINDLSGLGKCSLTAAIPVISVMGLQACPLPTAVLSNQTGYDSCFCDDYTEHMEAYMLEWKKRGFQPDGVYTGFLAREAQADKLLEFFDMFVQKHTQVLVDPIMGDGGAAFDFCTEKFLLQMQTLAERAWYLTPNLTEAMLLLYGKEGMKKRWKSFESLGEQVLKSDIEMLGIALAERFSLKALSITGVTYFSESGMPMIGNFVFEGGKSRWISSARTGGSFSGTGDLFAAAFLAGMMKGKTAFAAAQKAVDFLSAAIAETVQEGTDRNEGVCFESKLSMLMEE
jgi:pyridoxine kinase